MVWIEARQRNYTPRPRAAAYPPPAAAYPLPPTCGSARAHWQARAPRAHKHCAPAACARVCLRAGYVGAVDTVPLGHARIVSRHNTDTRPSYTPRRSAFLTRVLALVDSCAAHRYLRGPGPWLTATLQPLPVPLVCFAAPVCGALYRRLAVGFRAT